MSNPDTTRPEESTARAALRRALFGTPVCALGAGDCHPDCEYGLAGPCLKRDQSAIVARKWKERAKKCQATTAPRTAGVAHILAQRAFHDPAFIIGDRPGLARIRDAINDALDSGEARRGVFAQDGEGYGVHVLCVTQAEMDGVPYGYTDTEMCGEHGPWTDAMIRSVQNGRR